jgi:HEAT repeat protein
MQIIKHSDPNIRRRTVWASRQLDIEFVMPLIEEAIKDPDPGVREATIRVVAESNIEQAVLLAIQILPEEVVASVRTTAVVCALGKSESELAILELLRLMQDTDANVSGMATFCLEEMSRKIVISIVANALKNKIFDVSIRKSAAKVLGDLGDKNNISDLFEAQLDLNEDVAFEASYALNKLRNRIYTNESDVLRQQEHQRQYQIIMWREYLTSEEPTLRGNAVYHLASFLNKEEATHLVESALDDQHHYVRGHAISNLVRLIGKEAIPQAIRALDDPHHDVCDKASQALLDLRKDLPGNLEIREETVSNLIRILDENQNVYVRSTIVNTLTNLCLIQPSLLLRQDLEDAILNASSSSDNHLRQKVARALGQFNTEKSTRRLLQLMGDSVSHTVLTATDAIKIFRVKSLQNFFQT